MKQGSRSVDDYAEEFHLLLTRNDIQDSQLQRVSRFIGGLRQQLQNSMAQFDPSSVAEAHKRAASFEQQLRYSSGNTPAPRVRILEQHQTASNRESVEQTKPDQQLGFREDETGVKRSTRNNLKCFACGEPGHRSTACPNKQRRSLVLDESLGSKGDVYDSATDEDCFEEDGTLPTHGDVGHLLVSRRSCLAPPSRTDTWLRTNIFKSTCIINGRFCTFIIDSGSSRHVVAESAVLKLGLPYEKHPTPYSLTWFQDGVDVHVSHRALVPFSIGPHYKDRMYCNIAQMDVSHLILGRPWEFDRKIIHDGAKNTYRFTWETHQILLLPSRDLSCSPPSPPNDCSSTPRASILPSLTPPLPPSKYPLLCSYAMFKQELHQEGIAFSLLSSTTFALLS